MTYFKIFAISVVSSLLFLSVFVMVAFDSENTLRDAYSHFENKEYYEARHLLLHADSSIPLADFYLYEAYLAREELGIKKSQNYLLQAYEELKKKKSSTALEIGLNLALDAYLQKDIVALQTAIEQSASHATPQEPWVHFFQGCIAYLEGDYHQALKAWDASKSRHWLSNWMKTSFTQHLPSEKLDFNLLHSEIETGQLWGARKKLEQALATHPEQNQEDIHFLLALSYIKEGEKLPSDKRSFAYLKSLELLNLVSSNNSYFIKSKKTVLETFRKQILLEVSHQRFADIPNYTTTFEKWESSFAGKDHLEIISSDLARVFNENMMTGHIREAEALIQGLSGSLPETELKRLFILKLAKQMYQAIDKGSLQHLDEYLSIYQNIVDAQNPALSLLADLTSNKILELIESDLSEDVKPYISLWKSLEKDPSNRYSFAQQLVNKAQRFWSVDGESQKAIALMKLAKSLPYTTEQGLIQSDIERAVIKTYRQAVLQDHEHELSFIHLAVKEFNFSSPEIFNPKEINNQLADAQFLFNVGRFPVAYSKATFVLQVQPNNQIARRIAALTAYQEGLYEETLAHIKLLTTMDAPLNEALAVSKILTNELQEGLALLQEISEKSPLSYETLLRLGFGHLILSQPDYSLAWLNKISESNTEPLIGFYIAAFQKQEWQKVVDIYGKLPNDYNQIAAIKGIAIQAFLALNQMEKAQDLFAHFLLTSSLSAQCEEGSKAFMLLQKHLGFFNGNEFAARYFLHVKNDRVNALKHFKEVKNASTDLLLERAQLAFSLNDCSSAIQDLQKSIKNSDIVTREKALKLLGNIYLQLGFYPDSVRYFNELFALNPLQNPSIHQSYSQALMAIGRSDLASHHFHLLGMHLPEPINAPHELGLALNVQAISASKRLKALELQLKQYPESISLQILLAKEQIAQSEKADSASEELLLAYKTLEDLNKSYSYIPESWFLQGQVLAKLHFNDSAARAYVKSVGLNPHYAESYKQLALVNIAQNDFISAAYNFKRTLQIAPQDIETWNSLAHLYESQHQLTDAVQAWTEASKLNPENPTYFMKIAKLNLELHQPQEAVTAIERALSLSPQEHTYWKILQQALQHSSSDKIGKQ